MNYQWGTSNYYNQMNNYYTTLLNSQNERIEQLETAIEYLQNEIATIKQQQSQPSIDKIEYKFDQLKVERLEGTLNIGLTPSNGNGTQTIDDFSVNQNELNVPNNPTNNNPDLFSSIKNRVNHYLTEDCIEIIKNYEQKYNYPLDDMYRQFIISDVQRQMDQRIQFYLNNVDYNDETQVNQIEKGTFERLKEDINSTFDSFIKHLPRKG